MSVVGAGRAPRLVRGRRALALALLVPMVAAGLLLASYGRQVTSYVTHLGGSPIRTWSWTPFPADGQPLVRIAAAGDVGTGGGRERRTAEAMARLARIDPYAALLLLGDSVYPGGDPALVDDRVLEPFAPVLQTGVDLLAILGNHDVAAGKGDEVLARLGMTSRWWARSLGPVLVVGLDSTTPDDPLQRAWLSATLARATERWKIVALHHPPYSGGYQGSSLDARAAFSPIFEEYGVQLVLSGHEHDYQRMVPVKGVTYIVSGAAAETRRTGKTSLTAAAYSWHHFLDISAFADRIVVRAVNQDGRVFDEVSLALPPVL